MLDKALCTIFTVIITIFLQCLIYFKVEVTMQRLGSSQLFGQNCIALTSLQQGMVLYSDKIVHCFDNALHMHGYLQSYSMSMSCS